MIVTTVVDFFFALMTGLFSGLEFVGLPLELINTLSTILSYGVWVVGADVMAVFAATVVSWWAIRFAVGLAIFVWELLPLT